MITVYLKCLKILTVYLKYSKIITCVPKMLQNDKIRQRLW